MCSIPGHRIAAFTSFARATSKDAKAKTQLLFFVVVLLVGGAAAGRAQSALDGFDPNANGAIRVVVLQPDGKILIGGDFTTLSPNGGAAVTRNRIARLNSDGTLDTAFNPNANDNVLSLAVQADGKILAGGEFSTIGGQFRSNIARLDATTGLADAFDPSPNSAVNSIVVQADGKILVGGFFSGENSIGGQKRNYIARLDATTGLADSFSPNANSTVRVIAVQADGKILAGGDFTTGGGQPRNRIARFDPVTGLADSLNPNANGSVRAITVQADGKILVGGFFNGANSIGGQPRNRIARLDAATGLADSFDPNAIADVDAIAVQPDGKILAGGFFNGPNSIGGQTRGFIARLDATTGLADSFNPTANQLVVSIAVQTDGKILAGGFFTTLAPNGGPVVTRNRIARLGPSVSPLISNVQFSANGYTVAESAGFVDIIVTRSGDTSGTVTVDYATSDVGAEQRTDYTIGAGTLTFLPGEVSRTFPVLVVDDLYVEGNETLNLALTNPTGGAQLNNPSVATLTITDNDSTSATTNPDDQARFFVQQHFYDFLSRYPDTGGWDFWTGQITQCGSDPTCLRNKRIDVSNAFFYELEYQQTGAYVFRLYRAAFGNNQPFPNPDNSNLTESKKLPGYAVFAADRARVVGGASLASGQQNIANAFVQRAEFLAKYPASQDAITFVDAVLSSIKNDSGVDLNAQRTALINLCNSGGRGAVLYRLADDNASGNPINNRAFIDAEYNRAFVATQYFGYLRRDADIGGYLFWLGQVNGAPLRDTTRQHSMVCAFITAAEYQQRFSAVVTHSNLECP